MEGTTANLYTRGSPMAPPYSPWDYSSDSSNWGPSTSPVDSSERGRRSASVASDGSSQVSDAVFYEYFDMDGYLRNASSATSAASDTSSVSSPRTPSDHGPDAYTQIYGDGQPRDESSAQLDQGYYYPQGPDYNADYSRKHARSSDSSLVAAHASSRKTTRTVYDPDLTKKYARRVLASPCRIKKTQCTPGGICTKCVDNFGGAAPLTCIREKLKQLVYGSSARWYENCKGNRWQQQESVSLGNASRVWLYLPVGPPAPLELQNVQARGQVLPEADNVLADLIYDWGKKVFAAPEYVTNFSTGIDSVLAELLGRTNAKQHDLVKHAFRMRCFAKIWGMNGLPLFYTDVDDAIRELPPPEVQRLHLLARQMTAHLESSMMVEVDKYLKNDATKDFNSPEEWISLWAALWAMILLYRDALLPFREENGVYGTFVTETTQLYHALIVTYAAHFRTSKVLGNLKKITEHQRHEDSRFRRLRHAYRNAFESRSAFYDDVQSSDDMVDELLNSQIIEQEYKVDSRKPRKSKAKSRY